ncbi:arginase family protein [Streptomyces sp. URMC 126]|uniref:arginase family protein n=1 Tax=Streptomyces sp. URMC 126 TaxID=3423401 RepID=UPI003F1B3ABF
MECINPRVPPHHAPFPTFMRLPHVRFPRGYDVVVVGAPHDGGTGRTTDARFGPRTVRAASREERGAGPEAAAGRGILDLITCVDAGDLDLAPGEVDLAVATAERRLGTLLRTNAAFLMLGGGHALTVAALRAVAEEHGPVALVRLDARSAAGPEREGGRHHQGPPLRQGIDERLVDPTATVRVGGREPTARQVALGRTRDRGVRVVTAGEFDELGVRGTSELIRERIGFRPLYVSVGIGTAGPAPAPAPGTAAPAPAGLGSREILSLLHCVGDLGPVGFDVMEAAPLHDPGGADSALAADVGAELLRQYARAYTSGAIGSVLP